VRGAAGVGSWGPPQRRDPGSGEDAGDARSHTSCAATRERQRATGAGSAGGGDELDVARAVHRRGTVASRRNKCKLACTAVHEMHDGAGEHRSPAPFTHYPPGPSAARWTPGAVR